jgi:hypothetical protein
MPEGIMGMLWAFCWGVLVVSGGFVGAILGIMMHLRHRPIAGFMSLGAGVLLSAASFKVATEALMLAGAASTTSGIIGHQPERNPPHTVPPSTSATNIDSIRLRIGVGFLIGPLIKLHSTIA